MLRYMLDTNICIYVIKNRPEGLRERFNRLADRFASPPLLLPRSSMVPRNRHGRSKTSRSSSSLLRAWTYSSLANVLQPITARYVQISSVPATLLGFMT